MKKLINWWFRRWRAPRPAGLAYVSADPLETCSLLGKLGKGTPVTPLDSPVTGRWMGAKGTCDLAYGGSLGSGSAEGDSVS